MPVVQSLYELSIQSLIRYDLVNQSSLECLSGFIKEDILNFALMRSETKLKLCNFLHNDLKVLQTRGHKISDEDLINIGKCSKLRVLEMNPPVAMRFSHPSNLLCGMLIQLTGLVKLHLQKNNGVTDDVFSAITPHMTSLQELDVCECQRLTDHAVESIATLPKLRALNISMTQVSDEGLMYLAKGRCALSLRELCANSCKNIRGCSFRLVIRYCKNLQILGFSGCQNLSRQGIQNNLNRKESTLFYRMCCKLPPDSSPCQHNGNTMLKLRNNGLLIILG